MNTIICENCGASAETSKKSGTIKCEYCGSKIPVILSDNNYDEYFSEGHCHTSDYGYAEEVFAETDHNKHQTLPTRDYTSPAGDMTAFNRKKRVWRIINRLFKLTVAVCAFFFGFFAEHYDDARSEKVFLVALLIMLIMPILMAAFKPYPPPPSKPHRILSAIAEYGLYFLSFLAGLFVAVMVVT